TLPVSASAAPGSAGSSRSFAACRVPTVIVASSFTVVPAGGVSGPPAGGSGGDAVHEARTRQALRRAKTASWRGSGMSIEDVTDDAAQDRAADETAEHVAARHAAAARPAPAGTPAVSTAVRVAASLIDVALRDLQRLVRQLAATACHVARPLPRVFIRDERAGIDAQPLRLGEARAGIRTDQFPVAFDETPRRVDRPV